MKKWLWLAAMMLLCGSAAAEDAYYINSMGGTKYHAIPDCPSISKKYHAGMLEVGEQDLTSDPYRNLAPCNVCGVKVNAAQSEEITLETGDYIVGVNIPQGLYGFTSAGATENILVQDWNGEVIGEYLCIGNETEVIHLYNEYYIHVPEGIQGRFIMKMNESDLDTGTRQLMITQPGIYSTYVDLNPGVYIVEATVQPDTPLRILNKADHRELRSFSLNQDAEYVIYLGSSMMVDLPEGCRLRSFCRDFKFNDGTPVIVGQGRYVSGLQLPVGQYTISAQPDEESWYSITTVHDDKQTIRKLEPEEHVLIDLSAWDTEIFLELSHCVLTFHIGNNG